MLTPSKNEKSNTTLGKFGLSTPRSGNRLTPGDKFNIDKNTK